LRYYLPDGFGISVFRCSEIFPGARDKMIRRGNTGLGWLCLFAMGWLLLAGGCARQPSTGVTTLRPANLGELQSYLLDNKADLELFRLRGPFAVAVHLDREILLPDSERIDADLFLSAAADKAPLVIMLHGLDNSKSDHAYQAMHLATWGMHCLTLQLPNQGPWIANGKTLARIVDFIRKRPEAIDSRIDVGRIVLAGHSFGGAATAIALSEGAPAAGGILLDPAGVGKTLPAYLRRIDKPVMVLAADPKVSVTLDRGAFYRFIRRGIVEVSIRDAAHEDAQYPLELDSSSNEAMQITFVSALTAAAFSLGATGKLDYAWASFRGAIGDGKLVNAKKK
jgi:pimeloyl-ACP methyl ester carboxylesterase